MRLGLGLNRSSGTNPLAAYALALDFDNQQYFEGGTSKALSAISGYSFTDNVDNIPNIDANGYTSLTAQASKLSTTANPVTSDQDFIFWTVVDVPNNALATEIYAMLGSVFPNAIYFQRSNSGGDALTQVVVGGVVINGPTVNTATRCAFLYRRRAGKDTFAYKIGSSVTVGAETGATGFAPITSAMRIGHYDAGTLQPNTSIEGVFIRTGTFADADLSAILTAA